VKVKEIRADICSSGWQRKAVGRLLSNGTSDRIKIMRTVSWHNKIDNGQGIRYGGARVFPGKTPCKLPQVKTIGVGAGKNVYCAEGSWQIGLPSLHLQRQDGDNRGNFQLSNIMQYKSANGSDTLTPKMVAGGQI